MVTKYGMSDKIGPIALESGGGKALFGQAVGEKDYSETVGTTIDDEVSKIMNTAYDRAFKIITDHRAALDGISKALIEAETLERDEFEKLLIANGITPKKKDLIVENPQGAVIVA
jgi:cell division protease FtsH